MKVPSLIISCPKCKSQALVRLKTYLPNGYDDHNSKVSMMPLKDALQHKLTVTWSTDEKK